MTEVIRVGQQDDISVSVPVNDFTIQNVEDSGVVVKIEFVGVNDAARALDAAERAEAAAAAIPDIEADLLATSDRLESLITTLQQVLEPSYWRVAKTTNQSITDNTLTVLTFDDEIVNIGSPFAASTSRARPPAGNVFVGANVRMFDLDDGQTVTLTLQRDSASIVSETFYPGADGSIGGSVFWSGYADGVNEFRVVVTQVSGFTKQVLGTAQSQTQFFGFRVSADGISESLVNLGSDAVTLYTMVSP